MFLKHFRNNLLNIYSFGLNRAEATVAEPAFITAEGKPRTLHIHAIDKCERPASSWDREGFKVKACHGHSPQSNDKGIQADPSLYL